MVIRIKKIIAAVFEIAIEEINKKLSLTSINK